MTHDEVAKNLSDESLVDDLQRILIEKGKLEETYSHNRKWQYLQNQSASYVKELKNRLHKHK